MNILHVLEDAARMIGELGNVRAHGGTISLTSLVTGRALGNGYLQFLHKAGEVAPPRSVRQVLASMGALDLPLEHYVRGNMLSVRCG